jgi:hypothetical protein
MGNARASKQTIELEVKAPPAPESPKFSNAPLLERGEEGDEQVERIAVMRDEPIDEGFIGWLPHDASEDDISRRWGGGRFRLQGRNNLGHSIKGRFRTLQIGGEPRFENQLSQAKWKRLRKQEFDQDEEPRKRSDLSPVELWELQERKTDAARAAAREDYERREAERDAAHRREMERLRLEAEARERERKAEDERRERDRQALEERRQKDSEEARARDREFFAGMIKLQGEQTARAGNSGMGLEQILGLLATARELFGGSEGGGDPVTALMNNLPAILDKSQGIASQLTGKPAPSAGAVEPAAGAEDVIQLSGVHAKRLGEAVAHLQAEGLDPDHVVLKALEALKRMKRAPSVAAPAPTPAEAPAPARQRAGASDTLISRNLSPLNTPENCHVSITDPRPARPRLQNCPAPQRDGTPGELLR